MTQKKSRNSKKASMKVKAPGARNSVNKAKYEIANEFGLNLGSNANSKQLNDQGMSKAKTNSRVNSKAKSRSQRSRKNCK